MAKSKKGGKRAVAVEVEAHVASHNGATSPATGPEDVDGAEARLAALQGVVDEVKSTVYSIFIYDIDTKLGGGWNPSTRLWGLGLFRLEYSCFVGSAASFAKPCFVQITDRMDSIGGRTRHHIVEFAESQQAIIRELAQDRLEKEVNRLHTSLITKLGSLDDALQEAQSEVGEERANDKAEAAHTREARAALAKARKGMEAALACAEAYDLTEALAPLLQGLREVIEARQEALKAAVGASGTDTTRKGQRYELFGKPVTSVLRWMGANGFSVKQAQAAMDALGVACSPTTVGIQVRRALQLGNWAQLTPEQKEQLLQYKV